MGYDQDLRDKIVEEYRSSLRSQGLKHGKRYMGMLELVLDKNLGPLETDALFNHNLFKSLEEPNGTSVTRVYSALSKTGFNPAILKDREFLDFYGVARGKLIRNFGKKSLDLVHKYLIKKGLIEPNSY